MSASGHTIIPKRRLRGRRETIVSLSKTRLSTRDEMAETSLADAIGWTAPAGWPAMSRAECQSRLTAPGERFEMETVDIRGIPTRVWKNAPPNLRTLMMAAKLHGTREAFIYEDERVTYDSFHRAVAAFAHELRARGVKKGDRVAIAMRNLPEWPVAFFATVTLG